MALRGLCSPLWLQMALYGSNRYSWLNTAPNGSYDPNTSQDGQYGSIWLFMVHRGLRSPLGLPMATDGSIRL